MWKGVSLADLHPFTSLELNCRGLGFSYPRPSDFTVSQWRFISPLAFTAYRSVLALGMVAWLSVDMTLSVDKQFGNQPQIWFLFATNWSFGVTIITFFILAVYCLVYNCPRSEHENHILYQPIWLLYVISTNATVLTSTVFWVMLSKRSSAVFDDLPARIKHSLVATVVLLDLCLSAIPFRLMHVIYPITTGVVYALFSYIYWLTRGKGIVRVGQVYPELNWEHPMIAVLACVCVLVVTFFVHLFLCTIYCIRVLISMCCGERGHARWPTTHEATPRRTAYEDLRLQELQLEDDMASTVTMETQVHTAYGTVE